MNNRDLLLVIVIGAGVGLLVQLILVNTAVDVLLRDILMFPLVWLRVLIFAFFVLLAPTALMVAALLGRRLPVIYQFAKFAAVGTLNTFIDLGVFNLQTFLSGIPAEEISNIRFGAFKAVSFLTATTNSFFWNKLWTFEDKSRLATGTVLKFYAITAFNAFLNVGTATAVNSLGPLFVSPKLWVNVIAPLCGIFAGFMGNFLGYKFLVFRKDRKIQMNS